MNESFVTVESYEVFVDQEAGEACQKAGEVCEKVGTFLQRMSDFDNELAEIREFHEVQLKELQALKSEFANQPPPPPSWTILYSSSLPELPPAPPLRIQL